MVTESSITAVGVFGLIVGLLLFAGGVTLLILSIVSTVKGKRRIGGIVGGAIFSVLGFAPTSFLGVIISGVVGSCVLIAIFRFIKK